MDSYLTFTPRGLHLVARNQVLRGLQGYVVEIEFVGEEHLNCEEVLAAPQNAKKKLRLHSSLGDACRLQVGSFEDGPNNHLSLGYDEHDHVLWTMPGSFSGVVWMRITTSAPPFIVGTRLRFIGPLVALVAFQDGVEIGEGVSLDDVRERLREMTASPSYVLANSVDLWRRHMLQCWTETVRGSGSPHQTQLLDHRTGKVSTRNGSPLTYRLSCVRAEKKNYLFKRQELVAASADIVIPKNTPLTKDWTVELKKYDIEVVLFLKSHCVAIGINLRPYWYLGAVDFSKGSLWPPDITPPYLSGRTLCGLVRLRPTTAQLMLQMAHLQPGDVLLDPCVGIGTIPVESQFLSSNVVALGGDLVLTAKKLASVGNDYARQSRKIQRSSSILDLFSIDACQLPFRTGLVDAVVSDLPFGQSCLSSAKLDQVLPLIISELSRVVRPDSGRLVLLCGSFVPVLEAFKNANDNGSNNVWRLPCKAVFPVNIGGLVAWIIQVDRGGGSPYTVEHYRERIRKLVERRDCIEKIEDGDTRSMQKRLQS